MDKKWIELHDRRSQEYIDGVESFFNFAFMGKDKNTDEIYCPCNTCVNRYCHKLPIVRMHIERKGFDRGYKTWTYHEHNAFSDHLRDQIVVEDVASELDESDSGPDMVTMVQDIVGNQSIEDGMRNEEPRYGNTSATQGGENYYKRLEEAEMPLHEGCENAITELSFVVEMLRIKQLNGWSNHSFTTLIKFFEESFSQSKNSQVLLSFQQANFRLGFWL